MTPMEANAIAQQIEHEDRIRTTGLEVESIVMNIDDDDALDMWRPEIVAAVSARIA